MQLWHPDAQKVIPADGHTGLSLIGAPWKIVLHTTETDSYTPNRTSFYGNPYWPHATITQGQIYQHLPIDTGGYALYNDGSVETNRANAIQCEVVWRAANAAWPDALLDTLALWISWVQSQTNVPTKFAEMFREGITVASVDSPLRFGNQEWLDFNGICGHSNIPAGNDHWDPGRLPVDKLKARLSPNINRTGEDVLSFRFIHNGLDWIFDGPSGLFFSTGTSEELKAPDACNLPQLGVVTAAFWDKYHGLATSKGWA